MRPVGYSEVASLKRIQVEEGFSANSLLLLEVCHPLHCLVEEIQVSRKELVYLEPLRTNYSKPQLTSYSPAKTQTRMPSLMDYSAALSEG